MANDDPNNNELLGLISGLSMINALTKEEGVRIFFEEYIPKMREQVDDKKSSSNKHTVIWESLSSLLNNISNTYPTGHNSGLSYFNIFAAGVTYGHYIESATSNNSVEDLTRQLKDFKAKVKREEPLRKKQISQSVAKEMCQDIAKDLWGKAEHNNTRLTKMCQEVWSNAHIRLSALIIDSNEDLKSKEVWKQIQSALPDTDNGIKPWLREIAPPQASKRGAPKK